MKRHRIVTLACMLALTCGHTHAYSTRTHQAMTNLALAQCTGLAPEDSASRYGVYPTPAFSAKEISFLADAGMTVDPAIAKMGAVDLVRAGAVLEDIGVRVRHHFYDPVYDRAFTPFLVPLGYKSPDWALEQAADAIGQDYSFHDLKRIYEQWYMDSNLSSQDWKALSAQLSLLSGHVAHHIQDMAQPQHTRNDNHFEFEWLDGTPLRFLNARRSMYEKFVDTLVQRDETLAAFAPCSYGQIYLSDLFGDDAEETALSPSRLWKKDGRGIAEYSNRGFVTEGTNGFGNLAGASYPEPVLVDANRSVVSIEQLCFEAVQAGHIKCNDDMSLSGVVTFYGNAVDDQLFPSKSTYNPRMTSLSVFSDDNAVISNNASANYFAQNRWTHFEAAKLLIPRAISYSRKVMVDYDPDFVDRGSPFDLDAWVDSMDEGTAQIVNGWTETATGRWSLRLTDNYGQMVSGAISTSISSLGTSEWFQLSGSLADWPLWYDLFFAGNVGEATGRDGVFGIFGSSQYHGFGSHYRVRCFRKISNNCGGRN